MNPIQAYEPPALPAHVWLRMPGATATQPDRAGPVNTEYWDHEPGRRGLRLAGLTQPPLYHYADLRGGYSLCGRPIAFHTLDFTGNAGTAGTPPLERRCLFCYREQIRLTGGLPVASSSRPWRTLFSVSPAKVRAA